MIKNSIKIEKCGFIIKIQKKESYLYKVDCLKTFSVISNLLHVDLIDYYKKYIGGALLDLGCGEKPYSLIYNELVDKSIGVDVENCIHDKTNIDIFASADDLPFDSNIFDCIICTNVLEHIDNIEKAFFEIGRVLKSNGVCIISVPFMYPLHEVPYDYYRFTSYGIEYQLKKNNFEIIKIHPFGGFGFFSLVYITTAISRIFPLIIVRKINGAMQDFIYRIYKKIMFKYILNNNLNPKITTGYFCISRKK